MREYIGGSKAFDIEEIEPLLVAYRRTDFPSPPELHLELLRSTPSPERLFPGAPNRGAVEYNFQHSLDGFQEALSLHEQTAANHGLSEWRDLLRLNLRHTTKADRYITNGQKTATVVRLYDGRFSVALHDDICEFMTDFARSVSLVPGKVEAVDTQAQAESFARDWLTKVEELEIAVRVDGRAATMFWRPWGSTPDPHGYQRNGLVLTLEGQMEWSELNRWMGSKYEPYAVLNNLGEIFPGVVADTCATCRSFKFTGMSRDMGGGSVGYCTKSRQGEQGSELPPVTTVSERCDSHVFERDSDRTRPYLGNWPRR